MSSATLLDEANLGRNEGVLRKEVVMPIARIEVRKKWHRREKELMISALHEAMVECLKIPEYDKITRFLEYEPEDFVVPPGCSENYVLVDISLFSGRSLDAKRVLYESIVSKLTDIGVPKKDISHSFARGAKGQLGDSWRDTGIGD